MLSRRLCGKGLCSLANRPSTARILCFVAAFSCALPCATGSASERIKRPLPTAEEAERIASDLAKSDGMLQKGDIVVSERGFLLYRGLAPDGITGEFVAIPNPLSSKKADPRRGK
jgi:hypothetical protein